MAGARQPRGESLPTLAPAPTLAHRRVGGALRCEWKELGVGMQSSKAILCSEKSGLNAYPPSWAQRPPPPLAATPLGMPLQLPPAPCRTALD